MDHNMIFLDVSVHLPDKVTGMTQQHVTGTKKGGRRTMNATDECGLTVVRIIFDVYEINICFYVL